MSRSVIIPTSRSFSPTGNTPESQKAIIYAVVCYVILPFGILTVVAGHLLLDVIGLATLKVAKRKLTQPNAKPNPQ